MDISFQLLLYLKLYIWRINSFVVWIYVTSYENQQHMHNLLTLIIKM